LAEQQVRRGPVKPPMPAVVRDEEADHAPLPKIVEPAKAEERVPAGPPLGTVAPKPGPVVRASPLSSSSLQVRPASFVPLEVVRASDTPAEPPKEAAPLRRTAAGKYGHDAAYRWLQGVLERHPRGYWCVRYCDPSVEGDIGGKVRLQAGDR